MSNLLEQASLVMIPSGYKEDVVYSEIPLDGSGDLAFTRASDGTRINSQGLVEVVPWNLQTYSEDFSNASWSKNNSPVMAYNVATAPNGTMTADSIQSNNASVYQAVAAQTQSVAPNSTVTLSIYIKKETSKTYFTGSYLYFTGGTTKLTYVLFDEVNGTINIIAPDEVSMVTSVESVGDWWRFIITGTDTGGNTNLDYAFYGTLSQNGTTLNPGIGSARTIWGAQLNIGSTAKPYFPTTDRLNVPRLTYQNGGGGCPSLLLEPQRTNLVSYSEQLDNGAWVKSGSNSVTANAAISPDGTQNADFVVSTATNSSPKYVYQVISSTATPTATIYAKAGAVTQMMFYCQGGNGIYFNLTNGSFVAYYAGGASTITSYSSIAVGNGWYRYSITFNTSVTSIEAYLASGGSISPLISNGDGFYLWGAQLEQSSYPTSYIPTTSSSATRVADYVSRSGLALTNSTFAVNFKPLDYVVELFDFEKTGGGRMFYIAVQSNGFITFNSVSGGTIGAVGSVIPKNQTCKLAFTLNASTSNVKVYINGSIIGTYATNITTFGAFFGLQSFGYNPGTQIEQIAIFPSVLTDAECISLTS